MSAIGGSDSSSSSIVTSSEGATIGQPFGEGKSEKTRAPAYFVAGAKV